MVGWLGGWVGRVRVCWQESMGIYHVSEERTRGFGFVVNSPFVILLYVKALIAKKLDGGNTASQAQQRRRLEGERAPEGGKKARDENYQRLAGLRTCRE